MKNFMLLFSMMTVFCLTQFSVAQQNKTIQLYQNQQEQCGSSHRHEYLMQNDLQYAQKKQLEEANYQAYLQNPFVEKAVVSIPVVVHVIHTGQALGTGVNITDAQIQSAIDNLNAAFSNSSTAFTSYTGVNTNIQFCLAQRDPSGNPTTGIVRVNGSGVTQYSSKGICDAGGGTGTDNEQAVKALSKWDNTKYYNFWIVTEINDNNAGAGTQGYAYFPGAGANVDGAVIMFNSFGYDPDGSLGYNLKSFTNRNVTTVHEVGHAMNLYHTFEGDGTGSTCPSDAVCGTSGDCVADTPKHKRSTSGCVADGTANACQGGTTAGDFQHNFMDYSSDDCQTEFTSGQSTRMNAALSSGGGRFSLTLSDGCNPVFANDASITAIVAPSASYCQTSFIPIVTLRNVGTATLTSVTITYNIDGGANQVFNWTGSLASSTNLDVSLNSITTTSGAHTFNAVTSIPNGVADQYTPNDAKAQAFTITASNALPYTEGFEGSFPPTDWINTSADVYAGSAWDIDPSIRQWEKRTTSGNGASTASAAINFFAYGFNSGSIDELSTPTINLVGTSNPELKFKVAYKYYGAQPDQLRVLVSTDCGLTFTQVYSKANTVLATNGQLTSSFTPSIAGDWRQETVNLAAYSGQIITLKFEGTNGYGNNLYLDDIDVRDNCTMPTVSAQPNNSSNCETDNTSFTITSTGGGTYQWQEDTGGGFADITDGGIYSTATTASLTLTGVTAGMNTYQYRCVVTNACGTVNSNAATLTVNSVATPTITAGSATTFCTGGSVTLTSSSASGNVWSSGETTQSISVSTAGTYTTTVTNSGCSATSAGTTVTVNPNPSTPTISAGSATTFCAGGSVVLTSSAGSGNTWSTGETTASITVNSSGNYTTTVTASGCSATSAATSVTVNANPPMPTITAGSVTTFCAGGSVVLTSSSASNNTWSSGETTTSITVSASGNYSVTVTNSGCSSTSANETVTVNPAPVIAIGTTNAPTACLASDGDIEITGSGTGNVTWTGTASGSGMGVTLPFVAGSFAAGTYNFSFDDGCTSNTVSATINDPGAPATPTITPSGTTTFCTGGSVDLTSSSATDNTWSTGETTQTITVSTSGTYSVTVTVSGCSASSANEVITVNPIPAMPTITPSGVTTFCSGGTVDLSSSSATNNIWSTGETTQTITVTTGGNYTVTVTNSGCSATSATEVVTVNPSPVISAGTLVDPSACALADGSIEILGSGTGNLSWIGTASGSAMGITLPFIVNAMTAGTYNFSFDDGCVSNTLSVTLTDPGAPATPIITPSASTTFCSGGSVDLTSSSAANNTWSTGETTQTITVTVGGNYSVTVTVAGCSASSANEVITVNPTPAMPTITPSGVTTFCSGGTVDLSSSSATNNTWSTGETTQTITVSTGGNYTVTVTNSGCSTTSAIEVVTVNPSPVISAGTLVDPSACALADGSIEILGSGTGNLSWIGTASGSAMGITLPFIVNAMTAGTHNFSFDDGCVSNTLSVTLTDPGAPATPIITPSASTTFCSGGSVDLTSSSAANNTWSTGETTQTITVSTAGTYSVTVTVSGCSASSANEVVTVNAVPAIALGTTTDPSVCGAADGSIEITGSGTGNLSWIGTAIGTSTGITLPFTTGSLAAGTYDFTFDDGCVSNLISATLVDPGAPATPTITPSGVTTFCSGGSVDLTSSSATNNTWSTGETTQTITVTTGGSYSVTVTVAGCSASSIGEVVTVNPSPATPTITPSGATTFCSGGTIDLTSSSASNNTWSTGETTQTITVSTSGNYQVTVDNGTCTASSAIEVVTVNTTPVIALGLTSNPTFCGASDGSIEITGAGTGTLSWTGSNPGTAGIVTLPFTIGTLIQGNYDLSFDDGCVSNLISTSITDVGAPATPTITPSGPTTFCSGGSVVLTSSSASGNTWSTGETTQSITVNTAGSYTVTFTSAGCSAISASEVISITASPVITLGTVVNASACLVADGSIEITGSGTGNLNWIGTASGSAIGVNLPFTVGALGAGTYDFTFDDGCVSNTISGTITDPGAPATPTITPSGATTFCTGGSVNLTSSSVINNTWSTGETTQTITVTTGGSYTVTVSGGACSSTSGTTIVNVNAGPATPTITASGATTFCSGGNVVLTSSSAIGNTWSNGATTQSITVSSGGNFSVSVSSGGCSASSAIEPVTVNPSPATPTISVTGATTFCSGASVTLTSSSAVGNTWSTGETTQAIVVTTAGSYTVSVSNGTCSSTSTPRVVNVIATPATPTITAGGATTFCSGNTVTLTSSSATGNTWSNGATTPSISVSSTGNYTVTVTNSGCSASSVPEPVTVNASPAIPTISADGPLSFCIGDQVILTSSALSGNTWSTSETTQAITVTSSGAYSLVVSNGTCSSSSAIVNVAVNSTPPPVPTISASGATTFCAGGNVVLTSSSATNNTWSNGATTQSITVNTSGNFDVTVNVGGCSANSTPTAVTVNPIPATPSISASGSTTFCSGNSLVLTSSASIGNSWSTGANTQAITVTSSGSYSVTVNQLGCTSSSVPTVVTVNLTPATPLILASGSISFCNGGSVDLSSTASSGNTWSNGLTTQGITVNATGTFTVTVSANGCNATSNPVTVTEHANPLVTISNFNPVCNTASPFVMNQGSPSGGSYSVNGISTSTFNPFAALIGSNAIDYTVTDDFGCVGSASTTIFVNDCTELSENSEEALLIYPNPTTGLLYLKGAQLLEFTSIELRDELGRLIASITPNETELSIDLSEYAIGIYTMRLIGNEIETIQKIQVMR